ncbi:nucleosome assembly protein 1 [Prunus yedoensis var. nudiflora]|uniref:Nucleosome assembly protein 1 n=1 Tax=Prunus yedoensis var. nudiflora TaxID=2094558 RepID=A0A314UCD4_PRUYE|nr:nucleosome assembly protein 1 [Prunus yedoensis var. nudiflora]
MEANMDVQKQKNAMPKAMDVSSFLLFEASGDSEADQNYPDPSLAMAEDDAQSFYHQRWGGGEHNNIGMPLPLMGRQLKSTVSVDSTKEYELLNEVEKSRLFWETCLAS